MKKIKCAICMDLGFVIYKRQYKNNLYDTKAYCICESGKDHQYDGRVCKEKSKFYCESIIDAGLDKIVLSNENIKKYKLVFDNGIYIQPVSKMNVDTSIFRRMLDENIEIEDILPFGV